MSTDTSRWKQTIPLQGAGRKGLHAKHPSIEGRRGCRRALMQHAWCFSHEDTLYTTATTQGSKPAPARHLTINRRIRLTESEMEANRLEESKQTEVKQRTPAERHIYLMLCITCVSLIFSFFQMEKCWHVNCQNHIWKVKRGFSFNFKQFKKWSQSTGCCLTDAHIWISWVWSHWFLPWLSNQEL